jgi:hypothetical protein
MIYFKQTYYYIHFVKFYVVFSAHIILKNTNFKNTKYHSSSEN